MNARKRKSVETLQTRGGKYGNVALLLIEYADGFRSFGVSAGGGLCLFGGDRAHAERFFAVAE